MNKNAIKNFAINARVQLISAVKQKAFEYGITEDNYDANVNTVSGRLLTNEEKEQRKELIEQIKQNGYDQVMEEVAYTWFNRFIALRFMEVNEYLPSRVRVFTDSTGAFKPEILTEALNLEIDGLDKNKVVDYIENNNTEGLYRYLLLTQCNALNKSLPYMFESMGNYMEMMLPNNILRQDSVIGHMVNDIAEDDWKDAVQIIGWLYQYYISDRHNQVINIYKGTVKKEDIPAATQLFTTDWVVRYMVDNSLGRYWIERNPHSKLKDKLQFLATAKDGNIPQVVDNKKPEEITFFDPCMGSGHILVYAFDILMEIYLECGFSDRDAAVSIVENNLFGLDIDGRAAQLSYFAVMMKARSYNRRILNMNVKDHLTDTVETNKLDTLSYDGQQVDIECRKVERYLINAFKDARELGSLIEVEKNDFDKYEQYIDDLHNDGESSLDYLMWQKFTYPIAKKLIKQAKILSKKYSVTTTNPPYMSKMEGALKRFVVDKYKDYSSDVFAVFMRRNMDLTEKNGYLGFMTPMVWMFIKSYEKLRRYILNNKTIATLVQMEYSAYEEATVPICSFVLKNGKCTEKGYYFRLTEFKGGMEVQKQKILEAIYNKDCGYFYESDQANFSKIPEGPIAYWVSEKFYKLYCNPLISNIAFSDGQILTGDNNKYLKLFWEIDANSVGRNKNWVLHAKGGTQRRWYGNIDTVLSWKETSINHYKNDKIARFPKESILFRKGVTWSLVSSSGQFTMRILTEDVTFNKAAATILFYDDKKILYVLGFLNSKVANMLLKVVNPTLNTNIKDVLGLPICLDHQYLEYVKFIVERCIESSCRDWDSFETSWDFNRYALAPSHRQLFEQQSSQFAESRMKKFGLISWHYDKWKQECEQRFLQLKRNEEELNRIFIDIYGLQEELTPDVADRDITVHRIYDSKDDIPESMKNSNYVRTKRDEIVSLLSYAVGCMFGRYSLDQEGLVYAGGDWDSSKYVTYPADEDNIIPTCDDDYFEDDLTGKFVKWVETVYGKDTLEVNLQFIAEALGGKGTSREVIRNYFLNEFYSDHLKTYQKRPIYWLFSSGKKNGFKALIYMHRYQPDLLARIRTDYVHEQQERYRSQIQAIEEKIDTVSASESAKLNKQLKKLKDQLDEISQYEEKIHHLADMMISIDLDDGVKVNYAKFQEVLERIK